MAVEVLVVSHAAIAPYDTAIVSQMLGPYLELHCSLYRLATHRAGPEMVSHELVACMPGRTSKDVGFADIPRSGGEEGVMVFVTRLGFFLNCVSGADQASDRNPEEEISDSPRGIGIHLCGTRR